MQQRSIFRRANLYHLVFWGLVFGLWYYLRYQDYETKQIALAITTVKVSALALLVYVTNLVFIDRFLYRKKYTLFILFFILAILFSSVLKVFLMGRILGEPGLFSMTNLKAKIYENVISDFFLLSAGAAIKLIFDYLKMQQRLVEVAKEKAETELNFLKSQINPHFLFNSLNSVYFLIRKDNPEARGALHKFSEMLRYQLYEVNGDKIPIEKEVSYLRDYVDLQQLRKDEKYTVRFNCSPRVKGFAIEPLLLIPFVENAFKHISNYNDQGNFVDVELDRNNGVFSFSVENSKEENQRKQSKGGIGMNNVRRRLELLYPGKHELKIQETADRFSVKLNLQLS